MEFPEELSYTKEHEWAVDEEGMLKIGITDYAQDSLGDVVFVELPEVGEEIKAGQPFGTVESVKSVSDLYAPVSGTVTEVNDALEAEPELVNSSPYDDGWMIKIEMDDPSEVEKLISAEEYEAYTKTL